MNKPDVRKFLRSMRMTATKHYPEILTGIGIAGMLTTTILAVKATPKAYELIEEERYHREREVDEPVKMPAKDVVKLCWRCYIPAAVTGAVSTACLIGACSVSNRRTAAITAAYKLSETTLAEYRNKVVETIGEKKERVVREKIAEDKIKANPIGKSEVIITEKGNTLCYDPMSDRYFKSDIDKIKRAAVVLNEMIFTDAFSAGASLNDFYDELNLSHTLMGGTLGWNLNKPCKVDFYPKIVSEEENAEYAGTPCVIIDYVNAPEYDY